MARRPGLTAERIVDVAAGLADRDGYDALTLAKIAAELGVRTPSLYNHVDGLDELRLLLTVRAHELLERELRRAATRVPGPADEVAGDRHPATVEALRGFAHGYRRFAHEHPGLYPTVVPHTEQADERIRRAAGAVLELVLAALAGSGLDEQTAVHAARALRSAVHGFVSLELAGGFGIAVPTDTSFAWLTDVLAAGMVADTSD